MKLKDTKANGENAGVQTLLHYLVKLSDKTGQRVVEFMDEMPHVEAAARISIQSLRSQIKALRGGMNLIKSETKSNVQQANDIEGDAFASVMTAIPYL